MIIYIYNDYGGTHTTSLAAAYHLNKLPKDRECGASKVVIPALKKQSYFPIHHRPFHIVMTIGGLLSRRLKINFIGVPLLVLGAQQCCNNIIRLVEHTRKIGMSNADAKSIIILENKIFKDDNGEDDTK